jgi:hypothetical protein
MDIKSCYDYLYEAATDFAKETGALSGSQSITTVASQSEYPLNPDFLEVSTEDDHGNKVIKYTTSGGAVQWLSLSFYRDVLYSGSTTAVAIPSNFAIVDESLDDRITGSATAVGTHAGGESTLTDSAASFTGKVNAGDAVYNTTQGHLGIVLGVTSGTALKTAMFSLSGASAYASWTSSDAYVIQPAPRFKVVISPPPSTAGDTITVPYYAKPVPVYSDYGSYRFATGYEEALDKYAVWLFKYRDSKPQFGDYLYKAYDLTLRKAKNVNRRATGSRNFRVNWMK